MSTPSFHLFPALPPELRLQIWEEAFAVRTVWAIARADESKDPKYGPFTTSLVGPAPHLAGLSCKEAWETLKRCWARPVFGTMTTPNWSAPVLFVPGNHEAYGSNWPDTLNILQNSQDNVRKDESLEEFVLLNCGVFRPHDSKVVILDCSLFSHIPAESEMAVSFGLNDFFQIDGWDVDAHNEAHKRDLLWLNQQVVDLEESDVEIVIFSHWNPTMDGRAADPRHVGSRITSGFATELARESCFKEQQG
ncbi:hypothetical protein N0V88_001115 [Collariella sp. IMI 366227]|nr:hypothetical protein N0V88_001115 [Collariella sp. IMI 366227]